MAASNPHASAIRALSSELKSLNDEPLEGFRVGLANEDNAFDWDIAIFGAPGTLYEGGYFKARMHFPNDYPYSPPTIRFLQPTLFHPNVYESGDLCISILHPPVDDPRSGELACERWNPTQNVRTILLSVVSLLSEPNTSSPANVDASVMYRRWRDSNGTDNEYEEVVKRQVAQSRAEAEKDGVVVPTTLEDYVVKPKASQTKASSVYMDIYDDDDDEFDYEEFDTSLSANESQLAPSEDGASTRAIIATDLEPAVGDGAENLDELDEQDIVDAHTPHCIFGFKLTFEYPDGEVKDPGITFNFH